jgi:Ser/Thr protein kinase RdoA (MazF antagonist)
LDLIQQTAEQWKAHGLTGSLVEADWPALTLPEVDELLRGYPQCGGAVRVVSVSPRPFSAASVVETPRGRVFVKRHSAAVRECDGLMEEHQLLEYLASRTGLVKAALKDGEGRSAVCVGQWTYEVHPVADGVDLYEEALSWTPFSCADHARAAGRAMAELHAAAEGYEAPRRKTQPLVSSFTIFSGELMGCGLPDEPVARMGAFLEERPRLRDYAEKREWRRAFEELLMPLYAKLEPLLGELTPLWTQNDFHASNLTWSEAGGGARVCSVMDFGLADRTAAVHDLATAIERNCIEWLRIESDEDAGVMHFDHVDALLAGYEEVRGLRPVEKQALVALLPLVHGEFALSETDYFLSVVGSEEKARLGYEGYFLGHVEWFLSEAGRGLLGHLQKWADSRQARSEGGR